MGYVVAAQHLQLGQTVALKFMRPDVLTSEYRSRFLREARNTARLRSKHVSRVLDIGSLESGAPYMVMEYLEGTDLSAMLHERGPFSVAEASEYILQACEAIAEAHGHHIVHRDLKPANLFLTRGAGGEPVVKVLDFGVSKVLDLRVSDDDAMGTFDGSSGNDFSVVTKATELLGSPSYMAPEQILSSRDADARSDIWSLGVILFRLVSGKAPFSGRSLADLIQNVVHGPMPNLRTLRPDLPLGFEHVVGQCMDRDRARRPSAIELARMLAPYAGPSAAPSLERIAILGPALVQASPEALPGLHAAASVPSSSVTAPAALAASGAMPSGSRRGNLGWALLGGIFGGLAIVGVRAAMSRAPLPKPPVRVPAATESAVTFALPDASAPEFASALPLTVPSTPPALTPETSLPNPASSLPTQTRPSSLGRSKSRPTVSVSPAKSASAPEIPDSRD